jgi:hypothetical protein
MDFLDGQAMPGRLPIWIAFLLSGRFAAAIWFPGWQDGEKAT